MTNVSVSVIIPAFNEETYISECLSSITNQSLSENLFEVIVVDNGSEDRTVEIARTFPVEVISSDAQYVGGVRNEGVRASTGEVLVFLDSDCVVDFHWIERVVGKLENSNLSAMGGLCLLRENPSFFERYWVLHGHYEGDIQGSMSCACIVTWRDDFDSVGGFPEDVTAGEDSAYSKLMNKQSGYVINSDLNVIHLGYPNTCAGFMRRQMWHSESYLQDLKGAMQEPVFLIQLFHLVVFASGILLLNYNTLYSIVVFLVWFTVPILFSVKRVARAGFKIKGISDIWGIYAVDFLYMIARELGLMSTAVKKLFGLSVGKSRRKV